MQAYPPIPLLVTCRGPRTALAAGHGRLERLGLVVLAQLVDERGGLVERGAALGRGGLLRGGLGAGLRGLGLVAGVVGQVVERGQL